MFSSFAVWKIAAFLGTLFCSEFVCDASNPMKKLDARVVNGVEATAGQFPWQVIIWFTPGWAIPSFSCGGTLLNEEWLLTAGHCLSNFSVCHVSAGMINYWDIDRVQIICKDVFVHEGFNQTTLANDIGVVQLALSLTFSDYIRPISLASDPLEFNSEILVSGWGQTSDASDRSDILLYSSLTIIDNTECSKIYGQETILDGMFCAVSNSAIYTNTCYGDSGGPAVVYNGDNSILIGIITFVSARGCEYGDPSGFTSVSYYREWIRQRTGA